MTRFLFAAFLFLLGSNLASAQELFPLQAVPVVGGNGCQDADAASTYIPDLLAAGWHCDPARSDDFDQDGGVFDTSKWTAGPAFLGNLTPVGDGHCSTITGYPPLVDSVGLHQQFIAGADAIFRGEQTYSNWAAPAGPYYVEYGKKGQPGLGYLNNDFFTENIGVPGPPYASYPSTSTEVDEPEGGAIKWYLWAPAWGDGILAQDQISGTFGESWAVNSNWYNYAALRNNGARTFYQNDGNPSPLSFADPYPPFDTSQESVVFQGGLQGPFDGSGYYECPLGNVDIVYEYIHTYVPPGS